MPKMIFVNLPVSDVERSARFYEAIGATKDARFCQDGVNAMMVFSETITVMLLSHERFSDFSPKAIPNAYETAQVLLCLSEESAAAVDATAERAIAAGGKGDPCPRQDVGGFMYGRSFEDPDGHIFEVMWMDVEAAMAGMGECGEAPAEAVAA